MTKSSGKKLSNSNKNKDLGAFKKFSNIENDNDKQTTIWKIVQFLIYSVCLVLFFASSWATFLNFSSNVKIRSTKVVTSPGDVLESPTLVVCNSSAFKQPKLPTTLAGYKNNTMSLSEFLVDAYIVTDTRAGILSFQPSLITDTVKEVTTMFHGTCIMIEKRFQVTYFCKIVLISLR